MYRRICVALAGALLMLIAASGCYKIGFNSSELSVGIFSGKDGNCTASAQNPTIALDGLKSWHLVVHASGQPPCTGGTVSLVKVTPGGGSTAIGGHTTLQTSVSSFAADLPVGTYQVLYNGQRVGVSINIVTELSTAPVY